MREQLKQLKNDVINASNMSKKFVRKRNLFNLKVEEAKEERSVIELFETDLKDSYLRALCFYSWLPEFIQKVDKVREEHPKYSETSIRKLVIADLLGDNDDLEQIEGFERMLDLYFLYDSCDFLNVRSFENEVEERNANISESVKGIFGDLKNETVDKVKNYDLVWEETKLNVSDVLTRTRRKIGKFLLDMDEDK